MVHRGLAAEDLPQVGISQHVLCFARQAVRDQLIHTALPRQDGRPVVNAVSASYPGRHGGDGGGCTDETIRLLARSDVVVRLHLHRLPGHHLPCLQIRQHRLFGATMLLLLLLLLLLLMMLLMHLSTRGAQAVAATQVFGASATTVGEAPSTGHERA